MIFPYNFTFSSWMIRLIEQENGIFVETNANDANAIPMWVKWISIACERERAIVSNADKEITQRRKNSNCRKISDLMRLLLTLILCFIHRKMSILISLYNKITHFMILYAFVFRSSLQIKSSKYRNKSHSVRNFMRNIGRYWSYWLSIKKFQKERKQYESWADFRHV